MSLVVHEDDDYFDIWEEASPVEAVAAQKPRLIRGLRRDEWVEYAIALASGVHLAVLLRFLLDWDDLLGSALIAMSAFIVVHYLLVSARATPGVAIDKTVTTVMWTVGAVILAVLAWMTAYVTVKGARQLSLSFFTQDLGEVTALEPGGGAKHALIGSVEQVGLATFAVVPVAVLTAVYLHELRGRMARLIRFIVDSLAGLPSIVAGLLIFTLWPGYAGVKAAAALGILALPIVTRTAEEVLKTVPDGLREASLALGAPQWRVVLRVVLPTAKAGLVTATLLAVARMVGETAPVILTAGSSSNVNTNPFRGAQSSLPTFVWDLVRVANARQVERAWGGALVLLILVLLAFAAARFTLARSERKLGRR
jgi:phosphate transport system permease protein